MKWPSALRDLRRLRSPHGRGLYASGGELYSDAIFGRDSIEAAEDLLDARPDIAREVIVTLAGLQGTVDAPPGRGSSEEERGKIHHEHRQLFVDGRRISPRSQELLEHLSKLWGGDGTSFTYYGSVDATPLYVRLVAAYCDRHGRSILDERVRDGTVQSSVLLAMYWLERQLERSSIGLVEFQRRNPDGLTYQVWKDSGTSFIHRDGSLANWDGPIAAVEVQGYAYDALLGAARLFDQGRWREAAAGLRQRVLDCFWNEDDRYFAMGIDRDATGRPRRVDSVASNGAVLLDSSLFDGHPDAGTFLRGVVERICGPELLTEVGVRCRSLSEDQLVDFQDYHGTWAVWIKEGYDVARGLRRQGFPRLARQVCIRLLNAVNVAGENAEFLYVSPDGRVHYDFRNAHAAGGRPTRILGTNVPEQAQAWTVSAVLAIKSAMACAGPEPPAVGWRRALEDAVLARMPRVDCVRTPAERASAFARRGDFVTDVAAGCDRDRETRSRRGPRSTTAPL